MLQQTIALEHPMKEFVLKKRYKAVIKDAIGLKHKMNVLKEFKHFRSQYLSDHKQHKTTDMMRIDKIHSGYANSYTACCSWSTVTTCTLSQGLAIGQERGDKLHTPSSTTTQQL